MAKRRWGACPTGGVNRTSSERAADTWVAEQHCPGREGTGGALRFTCASTRILPPPLCEAPAPVAQTRHWPRDAQPSGCSFPPLGLQDPASLMVSGPRALSRSSSPRTAEAVTSPSQFCRWPRPQGHRPTLAMAQVTATATPCSGTQGGEPVHLGLTGRSFPLVMSRCCRCCPDLPPFLSWLPEQSNSLHAIAYKFRSPCFPPPWGQVAKTGWTRGL